MPTSHLMANIENNIKQKKNNKKTKYDTQKASRENKSCTRD